MVVYHEQSVLADPFDIHTPQAYLSIVAANTSQVLYPITVGNKAKIRTLWVCNRTGGGGFLRIGRTLAGFVQVFPDLLVPAGVTVILSSEDLPDYWFREYNDSATDIIVRCSVGAADPTDVQVFCDVVEMGLG